MCPLTLTTFQGVLWNILVRTTRNQTPWLNCPVHYSALDWKMHKTSELSPGFFLSDSLSSPAVFQAMYSPYMVALLLIWQENFILAVARRPNQPPSTSFSPSAAAARSLNKDMKKVCQKWSGALIKISKYIRVGHTVKLRLSHRFPKHWNALILTRSGDLCLLYGVMCCCAVANGDGDRSGTSCTRLELAHVCVCVCVHERSPNVSKKKKEDCLGLAGIILTVDYKRIKELCRGRMIWWD